MSFKKSLVIVVLVSFSLVVEAVEIVRFDIQSNGSNYTVDIELFDAVTPVTVSNFLKYVEDVPGVDGGRYDGSFIHRKLDNFVIQGGGYTYDQILGDFIYDSITGNYDGGLQKVQAFSPIVNEFSGSGLSNIRGTIAMAKLSSGPDTATSQWFINLADNSQSLDEQNGGFTVFGQVLDAGMDAVDTIEATPDFDLSATHYAFSNLPLTSYVSSEPVLQNNLWRVNTARRIQRPILTVEPALLDAGLVQVGQSSVATATLTNRGNADLVLDTTSIAQLVSPFTILTEDCSTAPLVPAIGSCSITVQFSPVTTGVASTELAITPAVNPYALTFFIDVIAEAIPTTPTISEQNKVALVDFLDVPTNSQTTQTVVIQNRGGGQLSLSSLVINGQDSMDFSFDNGCTNATVLSSLQTCTLVITLNSSVAGVKSATLSINSNGGTLDIALSANAQGPILRIDQPPFSNGIYELQIGDTYIGNPKLSGIIMENTGLADLYVTSAVLIDGDVNDFTVDTSRCEPNLAPGDLCAIVITIASVTDGFKAATLAISSNDADNSLVLVDITASVGTPDIDAPTEFFVGTAQIDGNIILGQFTVSNAGTGVLQFSSFSLTGADASDFLIGSDCPGLTSPSSASLSAGESCSVAIQFSTVVQGQKSATLELVTNDPDEAVLSVALTAYGDLDSDGVSSEIEQVAPNSGDGNNDGLLDSLQNNVVSFLTEANKYATIAAPDGTFIFNFEVVTNPAVNLSPSNMRFDHGFFKFTVLAAGATPGAVVQLGVFLPAGDVSTEFYNYGPTPDNPQAHWYKFDFDGTTGARYFGDVAISPPGGGPAITKSFFILSFVDGERGDDDLTVNGEIVTVGAPGVIDNAPEGAAGTVSYWWLLTICGLLCLRCSFYYRSNFLN